MARLLSLLLLLVIPAGCAHSVPSGPSGATAIARPDLVGRASTFVTAQHEKSLGGVLFLSDAHLRRQGY
jgi:hypothetical protein